MATLTETVTVSHTAALARLGYALSDQTRARVLLALREAPALPSELAQTIGVSRQVMSNQLACLRGCGLVEAVPEGRNVRYRLTDPHLAAALGQLLGVVLSVDPACCATEGCGCS
jgi:ArsR family transcriptional regulator, cadmium/lead-responsive transcriptional repressor